MKIRMRKETVRCDKCKNPKDFYYLSDFSYGQRVIYSEKGCIGYINLLEDKVFSEYVDMAKHLLLKEKETVKEDDIDVFVDKYFGDTCDLIGGIQVDFSFGQKMCPQCGSTAFENIMIEPEKMVDVELAEVTHEKWNRLNQAEKEDMIIKRIKELKI